jgi:hypothetical protein
MLFFMALGPLALPLRAESNEPELAEPNSYDGQPQAGRSGFRIHHPWVFIGGRVGVNFPRTGSVLYNDIFNFVTRELTLEKTDFRAPMYGFDFGVTFHSRWAAVFGLEYGRVSRLSESRNFVDQDGSPINQTTRFSLLPITGTLRFYPLKMGESVGSYDWTPTRFTPYIGGGFGAVRYIFRQQGDFVDARTLNIFAAELKSDGFALVKHLVTGVDVSLTPLLVLNFEARYSWAEADLTRDFGGFLPINLSGPRLSGGVFFRF